MEIPEVRGKRFAGARAAVGIRQSLLPALELVARPVRLCLRVWGNPFATQGYRRRFGSCGQRKPAPEGGIQAQTGRAGACRFCNQAEMMWLRTA